MISCSAKKIKILKQNYSMVRLPNTLRIISAREILNLHTRNISKYLHKDKTSKVIRQKFLDYFINDNNHNFVRSSPVVPFCDPTVAFVNAGMNQFKGIFLGSQSPEYKRVANSQKCIRVGGKHNDLNFVGTDGYHHTFFEMLGNWSFGDYFKKEACELSWKLLTEVYSINKDRLYVTYFKGDSKLGLKPDLECKEIWKSLGIPENRILPFGYEDNFWEMGLTGPCGPCTEIHIDHLGTTDRSKYINKGLPDLTELWNIVFIQFNRTLEGGIKPLSEKHIDTGMGFERLTAVLQGKISNYDTDIFEPCFKAISKISKVPMYSGNFGEKDWNHLDTGYRILADHSRMITACLADGMIPEQNQKLRRIMRKAFLIATTTFKNNGGLLKELSNYVVENLGPVYVEMEKNINQIQHIIDYEEEVYKSLRENASEEWNKILIKHPKLSSLDIIEMPGLVTACKEILSQTDLITPKLGFKLYDTHGLDEITIIKIANALNLKFDSNAFQTELNAAKAKSKQQTILKTDKIVNLLKNDVNIPDDSFKYDYKRIEPNQYIFKEVSVKVLKIITDEGALEEIDSGSECILLLDKTNFYSEAGGQVSDKGEIKFYKGTFHVINVTNKNGYIIHKGIYTSAENDKLKVNYTGTAIIDEESRLCKMRNHTAAHLLNSAIKNLKNAVCQKSSKITENYLNLDVGIFGEKLTYDDLYKIETQINTIIKNNVEVKVNEIDSQQFLRCENITLIPGETYPENGIRLIDIVDKDFLSREPCCGTHVKYTSDIIDFCLIGFKSLGRTTTSLHAVTGARAKLARTNGAELLDQITDLQKKVSDNIDKPEVLDMAVSTLRQKLNYQMQDDDIIPVLVKKQCINNLNCISMQIKETAKGTLKEFIEMEMKNVLENGKSVTKRNQEYVIHYLRCSMILESVPLHRATKLCPNLPILVISYADSMVKARCCVPKNVTTEHFNAEKWLNETVATIFKSRVLVMKDQDTTLVCNMKPKRVNIQEWDTLLNKSLEAAQMYIEKHL